MYIPSKVKFSLLFLSLSLSKMEIIGVYAAALTPPPHPVLLGRYPNRLNSSSSSSLSLSSSSLVVPNYNYQFRFTNNKSTFTTQTKSLIMSSSSSVGAPNERLSVDSSNGLVGVGQDDLLIVGPGVLGRILAQQWRKEHPSCQIFGQTMTSDHHDELIKSGITPSLRGEELTHKFPYVIFCAPPSRTADYPGDIRLATSNWNGEGSFLFTSSSAPFDRNDNGPCDEDSPVVPIGRSPRTDVLLKSEKVVVDAGGCVLRLAGLYKEGRGAHCYWLTKGTVDTNPDHILNLIHYEDAASLATAILKKKLRGRIFLGCDNHPLSRQEIMELVNRSGKFSKKFQAFTGNDPLGKRLNNSKTRKEIGWEPKYPSFAQFLGIQE